MGKQRKIINSQSNPVVSSNAITSWKFNPKLYVCTVSAKLCPDEASPTIFVSVPSIMESIAMGVFLY